MKMTTQECVALLRKYADELENEFSDDAVYADDLESLFEDIRVWYRCLLEDAAREKNGQL